MMSLKHGLRRASGLVLILAVLWGCVSTQGTGGADNALPVGYRYTPTLTPGLASPEAARQDLVRLLGNREQPPGIKDDRQPSLNSLHTPGWRDALEALLQGGNCRTPIFWTRDYELLCFTCEAAIPVLEDRIEVSPQMVFYFTNLLDAPILVEKTEPPTTGCCWFPPQRPIGNQDRVYKVPFPGQMSFVFADFQDAKRFADDLFAIQQPLQKHDAERRARFEASAAPFRALTVKPPVSEEQRRILVQANALAQTKEYRKAIERYLAATDLDPVSYPAAYFNLALLYAQTGRFKLAIATMQQYLLLEPGAADARSAQDKIYEWELQAPAKQ